MGITESFCHLLAEITPASLSATAVAAARRLILDGVAVAVRGSREAPPQILAAHLRELGAVKEATALALGFRTSTALAAYVNGASMHVLDFEPMWNPPNHALSTTLPAVLALAESTRADGTDLIAALIKGVEAQGRLRVASGQFEPRELVFHPPGVVGVIGSAIASAHLLGLDEWETRNAVGLAASRSGTLIGNIGTMAKCTHCGLAAAGGVDSAMMARRGFTANADIIEAPGGLADAFFSDDWNPQALIARDTVLRIVEPGYALKMFPSQYATHFVILAALEAGRLFPSSRAITQIRIIGPIMPYVDRPRPSSGLEGKFSFQYAAACALTDGKVTVESFSDERCARPDVAALLAKVQFVQSPEIPASLDRMWVEFDVELASGEHVVTRCTKPKASWGEPIAEKEHLIKIRDCIGAVFDAATTERCITTLQRFDELDSRDIRRLIRSLGNLDAGGEH